MIEEKNYKFKLPSGRTVDIISKVLVELLEYRQIGENTPESCGLLMGYVDSKSLNETISAITKPLDNDIKTRYGCRLQDAGHYDILSRAACKKNYFMGMWHTHPQSDPYPSSIDWDDWQKTLNESSGDNRYVHFIIVGTKNIRVWAGDLQSKDIIELIECKRKSGLYV